MNIYGIVSDSSDAINSVKSLHVVYDKLPRTKGCENCLAVNGVDHLHYCCKENSPSMYYVEFLAAWNTFKELNTYDKQIELVLRAIRNYLSNELNKACIFYSNGCEVYAARPLSCRNYGIVPPDTWDKRYSQLKKQYGDRFRAREKQCDLVSTSNNKSVTAEHMDSWFAHVKACEIKLGVPTHAINKHDDDGGSYRTFHDHLLVTLLPLQVMEYLTRIRLNIPSIDEIDHLVVAMKDQLTQKDR